VTWQAKEAMGEAMGADRDALLKADEERMFKIQKVRVRACPCLWVACISLLPGFSGCHIWADYYSMLGTVE
jgi:hypothetical protein